MVGMNPPQPPQKPKTIEVHGEERIDPFYGYRDKTDQEVLNYIEAENRYTDRQMKDTELLQNELFTEMKGRIKETDMSAPVFKDDWQYYTRTEEGKQYPIFCRSLRSGEGEEEILLDQNVLAEGRPFLSLGEFEVSPDHKTVAYSVDVDGSETYTMSFKDLETGSHYADYLENTADLVWAMDSRTCFYTVLNDIHRPFRVYKHVLGTSSSVDVLVYEEPDERFSVGIDRSADDAYILIVSQSKETSEMSYLSAHGNADMPQVFWEREQGHEYMIEHGHGVFYVLSNQDAPDFRLLEIAPEHIYEPEHWYERIPHRPGHVIDALELFQDYVVVGVTVEGLTELRIRNLHSGQEHTVKPPEALYELDIGGNPEFRSQKLRFSYSSWITPWKVVDYDMRTDEWHIVKEQEVSSGFDSEDYILERRYATAEDGTQIPISLAYHTKILHTDNTNPLWLGGYGAYGITYPLNFSIPRLSLLDRGFVVAFAHLRGGGIHGRPWYESGKYFTKQNTFSDYIVCAEWLIKNRYTATHRLIGHGGSAGGLLIGAVANQRPDLFQALIAEVPFVDTLNTMLDRTLPLTEEEFEEWGNPEQYQYYSYIKSYAPYENVHTGPYPHMYVRSGLNDVRVSFWEPTKWVAKLRTHKQDDNLLLLRTDTDSGHKGASGRYDELREFAEIYAFAIKTMFIGRDGF